MTTFDSTHKKNLENQKQMLVAGIEPATNACLIVYEELSHKHIALTTELHQRCHSHTSRIKTSYHKSLS